MPARSFLYAQPESAERLLDKLADAMAAYLRRRRRAGAQALMLFESWAGLLAPREFERFALRAVRRTMARAAQRRRAAHLLRRTRARRSWSRWPTWTWMSSASTGARR